MSDTENPWNDDWYWDACYLGSYRLPGIATVDVSLGRKLDVKSAPGSDGATITDKGYEPAKVKIRCVMWTEQHKWDLTTILTALHPKHANTKQALDISHASTAMLGIRSVYIQTISGPKLGSAKGTKEIEFSCVEWMKPQKSSSTAIARSNKTTTPATSVDYFTPRTGTFNDDKLLMTQSKPGESASRPQASTKMSAP